jgi:hypothetical protein
MEIGGGERYLSQLSRHQDPYFSHYVMVHKDHTHTRFKIDLPFLTYETIEEANALLHSFTRIIDHQFYWYEVPMEHRIFYNIPSRKIIRYIHGQPMYQSEIRKCHCAFVVYEEREFHPSWNSIVKIVQPLCVSMETFTPLSLEKKTSILISGRICPDKIPVDFLAFMGKEMSTMCAEAGVAIPTFDFYGKIDSSYESVFMSYMKEYPTLFHYGGFVEPDVMNGLYAQYDVLMLPSSHEGGSYTVLEAMAMNCIVFHRPVGGLKELTDPFFQCSSSRAFARQYIAYCQQEETFREGHRSQNRMSVEKRKESSSFPSFFQHLYLLEREPERIPNIMHYVFGLEEQLEPFALVYYLSILSNVKINKPRVIYFHYQYMPYGEWWDKSKDHLTLNYVNVSKCAWKNKPIYKTAHKADKIRMEMLYKYGGVYMDIDTITHRAYHLHLENDWVMGIQEIQHGKPVYGNAILMCKPQSLFLKWWMEYYPTYFVSDGWCEASIHLMSKITELVEKEIDICILPQEAFYAPLYTEVRHIFETREQVIHPSLLTLHWWNSAAKRYISQIQNFEDCLGNSTLYAQLMKHIYMLE